MFGGNEAMKALAADTIALHVNARLKVGKRSLATRCDPPYKSLTVSRPPPAPSYVYVTISLISYSYLDNQNRPANIFGH